MVMLFLSIMVSYASDEHKDVKRGCGERAVAVVLGGFRQAPPDRNKNHRFRTGRGSSSSPASIGS
jgi:hypothetical protein